MAKVGRPEGGMDFRRKALIRLLGEVTVKESVGVLRKSLKEKNDAGFPTQRALDSAQYIVDQAHGKAKQGVDVGMTRSFDEWLKGEPDDD
jgi:hypothetical protein